MAKDPRMATVYASDQKPIINPNKFYLPKITTEQWCRPGYQPKRLDKGIKLTVNDYPFHNIQYGGPAWAQVVHTPFQTDN